jgi:ATPase subunit of ABC transporter with duplicated ATPase domains
VEKPKAGWNLKLDFAPASDGAREALRVEGLRKSFDGRMVLDGVDLHLRHGERVVLTGPNGGGKSTLLKIVAGELSADSGLVRPGAGVVVATIARSRGGWQRAPHWRRYAAPRP